MPSSQRWRIAALVCAAITISYFDRQTLPLAITAIARDIPISNTAFSNLQASFLLAYAVMYALGGRLIDALGTRTGFLLIMIGWSLACASHGFAANFAMLMVSRFLLGAGEGGGFPAATKVVSEWFSPGERSMAMGIINGGTALGAVLAPPLIAATLLNLNWRWVFFLAGMLGLAWSLWWSKTYRPPDVVDGSVTESAGLSWWRLFGFKEVWGLVGAKFLSDSAWYFYLFWLPKYLYDARGFDVKRVGYFGWIPYAAAGAGCLAGGWLSAWLLARGNSLNFSRKVALGLSAAVMPLIALVTHTPVALAIVLFSIAFFGQQSWSTLIMVLPADLFPPSIVGSVAGLVGFGGAIGGSVFGLIVGYLLDHSYGWGIVFGIVSTLHVAAFVLLMVTVRTVQPLRLPQESFVSL